MRLTRPFSTNRTRGYGDTPPDQRCSRSELRGVGADTDLEDELHLRVRELLLGDDHRLRELDELVQREHADPVVLS